MAGPRIPDDNHVSRACGGSKCDDQGVPLGSAFMLRPGEPYLSVNWLEVAGGSNLNEQLASVREHLEAKGYTLPQKGRLAVLHLETTLEYVRDNSSDHRSLFACHEPELPPDPSHAGIYGYRDDEELIADLIALSVQTVHSAK